MVIQSVVSFPADFAAPKKLWTTGCTIIKTGKTIYTTMTSLKDQCELGEILQERLCGVLYIVKFNEKRNKQYQVDPLFCSMLKEISSTLAKSGKTFSELPKIVVNGLGRGVTSVNRTELESALLYVQETMQKHLQTVLKMEILQTVAQLFDMCRKLYKTCRLVENSKKYRESRKSDIDQITKHLEEAERVLQEARDGIDQIKDTFETHPGNQTLLIVEMNLKSAENETEYAQSDLEKITRGIQDHSKQLTVARNDHAFGVAMSAVSVLNTAYQCVYTPAFMLTKLTKSLLAANGAFQVANLVGHSLGSYWTDEEIKELRKLQQEMNELKTKIDHSLQNISYCRQELDTIQKTNCSIFRFHTINDRNRK